MPLVFALFIVLALLASIAMLSYDPAVQKKKLEEEVAVYSGRIDGVSGSLETDQEKAKALEARTALGEARFYLTKDQLYNAGESLHKCKEALEAAERAVFVRKDLKTGS